MDIKKELNSNIYGALNRALRKHEYGSDYGWLWISDYDINEKFVLVEAYVNDEYKTYKISYTANEDYTEVVYDSKMTEVVTKSEVVETPSSEEKVLYKLLNMFEKHFGGTSKEAEAIEKPSTIIKQFDQDKMIEISAFYCAPDDVDGHGDVMSAEEIVKMVDNFNVELVKGNNLSNIDHKESTEAFTFIKAFVAECDMVIGDKPVREGTPLIKVQYNDADLWKARKSGEYTGWSIGARGKYVEESE